MVRWPRMRFSVRIAILLTAFTALGMGWWVSVSEKLPDGWDAKEFETCVRSLVDRDHQASLKVEVLAWATREDDRPLRYDSALVWARIEQGKKVSWTLIEVYRHPLEGPQWNLSWVSHSPMPLMSFKHAPTNSEIYKFVDHVGTGAFFKSPGSDWRTLNSRVRKAAWYRAVGEMPTRTFP